MDPQGVHLIVHRVGKTELPVVDRQALPADRAHERSLQPEGERGRFPAAAVLVALVICSSALSGFVMLTSEVSAYTPHAPFTIEGNAGFTTSDAVTGGSGIEADPYIISGWQIDTTSAVGIRILNTTAFFSISGVWLQGSWSYRSIEFRNVSNGTIQDSMIRWSADGVGLYSSKDITIDNCSVEMCAGYGLNCTDVERLALIDTVVEFNDNGGVFENDVDGLSAVDSKITDSVYVNARFTGNLRNASFVNCTFNGCSFGDGFRVLGGADSLVIENTSLYLNGGMGLSISGTCHDVRISNSTISRNSGGPGVHIGGGDRVVIDNNTFYNNAGIGVYLGPADIEGKSMICDNELEINWGMGIEVSGQLDSLVDRNVLDSNYGGGLHVNGSDQCSVSWNQILNNTKVGLLVNSSSSGNSIDNNTMWGSGTFFYFDYSENNVVEDNTVNGKPLVFLEGIDGQTVTDAGQVIAHDCDGLVVRDFNSSFATVAVELWGCTNCIVDNISGMYNWYGVYVGNNSDHNSISNCTFAAWSEFGVCFEGNSSENSVSDSVTSWNNLYGVYLAPGADNNTIIRLLSSSNQYYGLYSVGCAGTTVLDSDFIGNVGDGVNLENGVGHRIENNTFTSNGYSGVLLDGTTFSRVANNTIQWSSAYGVSLWDASNDNEIVGNTIVNSNNGIYIRGDAGLDCVGNLVDNNTLTSNSNYGLFLYFAQGNTLSYNVVTGSYYGAYIAGVNVDGNWIYLNTFSGHTINAYNNWAGNINYWNTSAPTTYWYGGSYHTGYLGNYWDDYPGVDADNNGVGDTYYLFTNDGDMYPLMAAPPVYIPEYSNVIAPVLSIILIAALVCAGRRRLGSKKGS